MNLNFGKKIISQEAEALKLLEKSLDKSFINAVNIITKTKGNIIISGVGKSGHIARKIVSTMNSTGTKTIYMHPTEASHGDLGLLAKNDTIIILSKSGNSKELIDIFKYAKINKNPVVLITGNKKSQLSKLSNCSLFIPNVNEAGDIGIAPTSSSTMMLSLGDALALTVSRKKKFTKKQFGKYHPGGSIGYKFLKVRDIMHTSKKIPLAFDKDKMKNVIITMTKKSFGCIGIINNKRNLIGIITDGDLRRNMSTELLDKDASQIMSKRPKTISEETYIEHAISQLNSNKITSFFVVRNNKEKIPVGIIHLHDCLRIKE